MVGPDGLEPSTPRLSSACSNQLSYEPKIGNGFNLWVRGYWWSRPDSNRRRPACKAGALPTELRPQMVNDLCYKERYSQNLLCAINRDPEACASFDHRRSHLRDFAVSLERR